MSTLLLVVMFTLLISTICSLYEAVLLSTRQATLESARTKGRWQKVAEQFIFMKNNIAQPIAAILILNTLSHTAGATLAGMYAATALGQSQVPLFSVIFSLAILLFSEILPKTIGASHWRKLWPSVAFPLKVMTVALGPAVYLTQKFADLFTRGHRGAIVTEDEIVAMIHLGAHEGEISQDESRMVRNIIELENKRVREIMTPRTMIFSLDGSLTIEAALQEMEGKGFTRIPVYEGHRENIIGYIMLHDLTSLRCDKLPSTPIKAMARPLTFVPESMNCFSVLMSFLKNRRHLAVVSDEFGGVAGLVSLEDLLETILGAEIVDETDRVVDLQADARSRKENRSNG